AQVLADSREGAQLGLAITNDSDQSISYSLAAGDSTGQPIGNTNITIAARSSSAKFLNQFLPSVPSDNFGQVVVAANNGAASVIALRYTGGAFTTIPSIGSNQTFNLQSGLGVAQTIAVSISPTSAQVNAGQTQPFTATVTGTSNISVIW